MLHSINLVCIYLKSSTNVNAPVHISSNRIYHLSSCSTYSSIYQHSPPLFAHCSDCLSRVTAWKIKTKQRPKTSASVQCPEGNCSDWSHWKQLEGLADGVKIGLKGETEKEGWSRGWGEEGGGSQSNILFKANTKLEARQASAKSKAESRLAKPSSQSSAKALSKNMGRGALTGWYCPTVRIPSMKWIYMMKVFLSSTETEVLLKSEGAQTPLGIVQYFAGCLPTAPWVSTHSDPSDLSLFTLQGIRINHTQ